jgi:hypothetical protein
MHDNLALGLKKNPVLPVAVWKKIGTGGLNFFFFLFGNYACAARYTNNRMQNNELS